MEGCLPLSATASVFWWGLTAMAEMAGLRCLIKATCSSSRGEQKTMQEPATQRRHPCACPSWRTDSEEDPKMLSNLKLSFYESIILQILPRTSQLYSYPCAHPFILAAGAIVSVCWATFHDIGGYIVLKMEIRKKLKAGEFAVPNCQYVIIDTDAGGDDSQAILLAISEAKRTGKTIVGITCIDGNAALDDVAVNVLINVCLADADIPVFKGSRISIMGPTHKDYYFSKDGIGMKQKEYVAKLKQQGRWKEQLLRTENAVDFIVDSANKYPGNLAIIAIGPLTNLALAYHIDNSIAEKVAMVSLMGGSISAFGIRQFFAAEFNFFLDAEAARIVTDVFPNVYINSFDLSFDLGTKKTLSLFTDNSREKSKFIHDIHSVILETHRPALCDPLACIPVFSPEDIISIHEAYGNVELDGQRTRGLLVFDWLRKEDLPGQFKLRALAEINLPAFIARIDASYN